eukprot:TRINITY_DN172_c0_g1_i2.p1 TRINITY_DN172_c0_g1~~TRINITY_DN172_c0_g1_i2.p1  ORF type:complete len:1358 (+),score=262.71 TRINITY_DN172_c0_g1_i2:410-4075(+)
MTDLIDAQPNGLPVDKTTGIKELLRTNIVASFSFIYDGDDTNVFTADRIAFMRTAEKHLENDPEFKYHCVLEWIPVTADCPGYDCPWYQEVWDYTGSTPMHGSKLICGANFNSISWVMFNTRIVYPDPVLVNGVPLYNQCDLVNDLNTCLTNGTIALIASLNTGETYDQKRTKVEAGGIPPTDAEVLNFVKLFDRLRYRQGFSWLSPFFDKQFANNTYPKDDPRHYDSYVTRANIPMGGPIERVDPKYINPVCQTRTKDACTSPCIWSTKAGIDMNQEGCIPDQYLEVGEDDSDTQQDQIKDFTDWGKDFTSYYDDISGPVDVLYFADGVMFEKFLEIIMRDALLAIVSFLFVYLYLQIHTGSFFLATLGMIQVIMPFPMGYFVYRVIFQIKAFYGLSTLTLYIVLAIGADDIFVFMDNWVQADVRPRADNCTYMKGRMAHSWKIAGTAMGITSVTTMAAFIATMTSPLMEIGLFGLFAAILVFFDYLLVMTFFAAAVVLYHRNYENTVGCCCCGTTAFGKFCNCCTCFTNILNADDENKVVAPDVDDKASKHSSSSSSSSTPGEFTVPPRPDVQCMETLLVERRTPETLEEARELLGASLDLGFSQSSVPPEQKDKLHEAVTKDKVYRFSRTAGIVLLVIAVILYISGFASLQSDHNTGYEKVFAYSTIIIFGLILFDAAMNAFRTAHDRRVEIEGHSPAASNFMVTHVAPFLSGTSGIGSKWFVRIIPGTILIGFWIVLVIHAFKLDYTTKTEQWLPDWHPLQKFMDSTKDDFVSTDTEDVQTVQIVFGVDVEEPIDRSGTDKYDPQDRGHAVYSQWASKQSDLSSEEFQQFIIAMCDHVLETTATAKFLQRTMINVDQDPRQGLGDQNCFMRGFRDYVISVGKTFPVAEAEFLSTVWEFSKHQSGMNEALEPYQKFYDKILFQFANGEEQDPTGIETIFLEFNTTLKEFGNAYDEITDWFDAWEDYMDGMKTSQYPYMSLYPTASAAWSHRIMHSSEVWVWMNTQYLLVRGAFTGTLASLGLATFIIFLATFNILIAFFVLLELCGVVGCTLGMTYVLGWELGMIESVSITILVGLSVDYVVHFAVHYNHVKVETEHDDGPSERQRRVHEVVADMGPTVLGGAATSIGASLVLVCTWIQFFYKFGIIFLLTILFSYLWSMLFFLPMMSFFGPQQEFLSFRPLLARCAPKWFGKEEETSQVTDGNPEHEMKKKDDHAEI